MYLPFSRVTANGEMLGLSLVLEEIATTRQTCLSGSSSPNRSLSDHEATPPATRVKLMKDFLVLSLQLERLRYYRLIIENLDLLLKRDRFRSSIRWAWTLQVLGGAHSVSTQLQARQTDHAFRERVVGVARREVARQQMMLDQAKLSMEGVCSKVLCCSIRGLRSPIHQQDVLDESMSHSNTFMTEGGVSGGGANSESLSPDQLENISETKLRRAQVIVT